MLSLDKSKKKRLFALVFWNIFVLGVKLFVVKIDLLITNIQMYIFNIFVIKNVTHCEFVFLFSQDKIHLLPPLSFSKSVV